MTGRCAAVASSVLAGASGTALADPQGVTPVQLEEASAVQPGTIELQAGGRYTLDRHEVLMPMRGHWRLTWGGGTTVLNPGDTAAILSETQSRALNVHIAELALLRMGARPFHVVLPTPRNRQVVPIRSTGASEAIGQLGPVVSALQQAGFYAEWKGKFGDEAWSALEASTGKLA